MTLHHARTPTRIDLAGGWTDVPAFAEHVPGAVLSFAVTLHSHVRIRQTAQAHRFGVGRRVGESHPHERISMYSLDYDAHEELSSARAIRDTELTGNFALVKAALRRQRVDCGLEILTRSEAPPGSGLGTSASMGVALIGALDRVMGFERDVREVAETAVALETEELGILSGKQDHYAAAFGGVLFMTFEGPTVRTDSLSLDATTIADLERRTVLVYTGQSRLSSDLHRHVVARFTSRDPAFFGLLDDLARIARDARIALEAGRLDELARLVQDNWKCQKSLYAGISTEEMESLCRIASRNGALGMKACGAGGGGCLVFLCDDGAEGTVAKSLREAGATILPFVVAREGLLAWSRAPSK